jgi:hypothetical protein
MSKASTMIGASAMCGIELIAVMNGWKISQAVRAVRQQSDQAARRSSIRHRSTISW